MVSRILVFLSILVVAGIVVSTSGIGKMTESDETQEAKVRRFNAELVALMDEALARIRQYPEVLEKFPNLAERLKTARDKAKRNQKITRDNAIHQALDVAEISDDMSTFGWALDFLSYNTTP